MSIAEHITDKHMEVLEGFFREEYAEMLSVASYMLNSRALAEVAVQDTFVVAIENMDKFTASPSPLGWLYNVLKNNVRHIRRDRQSILKRFVSLDDAPELDIMGVEDKNDLLFDENSHEFDILIQFYVQGYTLKELAQKYGISIGACKMRIKRAKERFKKISTDL